LRLIRLSSRGEKNANDQHASALTKRSRALQVNKPFRGHALNPRPAASDCSNAQVAEANRRISDYPDPISVQASRKVRESGLWQRHELALSNLKPTPKIFAVNINYGEEIMSTQKQISYLLLTFVIGACCFGAALTQTQAKTKPKVQYHVSNLVSLGGTSSGGNSINDQSWCQAIPDRRIGTGTLRCGETVC